MKWLYTAFHGLGKEGTLALLTWVLAVAAFVPFVLAGQNTLLNNRHWFNMKAKSDPTLNGVGAYFTQTQALAGNRLNLDAWHGYHEVLAHEKVYLRRMDFQFRLGQDAYVICVFDRSFEHFKGFRLSTHPAFPNAALEGTGEGAFTERIYLPTSSVTPDRWHKAKLVCEKGEAILYVDGHELGRQSFYANAPRWAGFRGGAHKAQVDNVYIEDVHRGVVLHDDFAPHSSSRGALLRIAAIGALVSGGVFMALSLVIAQPGERLANLISVHLCAMVAGCILSFYAVHVRASFYPQDRNDPVTLTRINEEAMSVAQETSLEADWGEKGGVARLLFLGTSQTFGTGADAREASFVELIAAHLRNGGEGLPPVECINTAIPGAISSTLVPLYRAKWHHFAPDLVVVNLGVNDCHEPTFPNRLENLIQFNRELGIRTAFVCEAAAVEFHPQPLWTHLAMARKAAHYGIPCWDSYGHLVELSDTGFLWWDVVHPTNYGHRLIAEFLLPRIQEELGQIAPFMPETILATTDSPGDS
jgi:lysophospholipase L1-like esterase